MTKIFGITFHNIKIFAVFLIKKNEVVWMISIHKHSDLILNPFRIQFKLYMILHTHTQTQGAVKRHVVCVCVCVWGTGTGALCNPCLFTLTLSLFHLEWSFPTHCAKHTGNYLPNSWVSHAQASQNLLRQLFTLMPAPPPPRSFSICVCLQNHTCEFCF